MFYDLLPYANVYFILKFAASGDMRFSFALPFVLKDTCACAAVLLLTRMV